VLLMLLTAMAATAEIWLMNSKLGDKLGPVVYWKKQKRKKMLRPSLMLMLMMLMMKKKQKPVVEREGEGECG
jgi:hypothetical protein